MAEKVGAVEGPKKVPPRNDLKRSGLYKNSRANELQGRDPAFHYEWKTTDEQHPHCLSKTGRLTEHEYGTALGGFHTIDGWQPVQRSTDPRVKQVEARDDQGKPVDTLIRHGRQILCRIPVEEHAKYAEADKAYNDELERQIYSPERGGDNNARMTAVVSADPNADQMQMLRNSGHPVPGIS